ncbi:MAG: N-acetyl-D-Glu racemase DgcA [Pseudomonadota bacterium]
MPKLEITAKREAFPIAGQFRISRGAKTQADVITVEIRDGTHAGRGECVPYARYGETLDSVESAIRAVELSNADGIVAAREQLQSRLPSGAARNALDCALWDLQAKCAGEPIHHLLQTEPPRPLVTAYTLSLDTPENMAEAARSHSARPLLKIKLGGDDDIACMRAVAANAPNSKIIIDANEGWADDNLNTLIAEAASLNVALIEQPLSADHDEALAAIPHPVRICADESVHTTEGIERLRTRYDVINIKLDKTGGLTEALKLNAKARELGFGVMVGCMVGSSLAMAPAILLAQDADYVDLDGPLLLGEDRDPALHYEGNTVSPAPSALWG